MRGGNLIQLYLCWIGNEDEAAQQEREVSLQELGESGFRFREGELLSVRKDEGAGSLGRLHQKNGSR